MKNIVLSILLAFVVVGGKALGNESETKTVKKVEAHVSAQLGNTNANRGTIYIYSKENLRGVSFSGDLKIWGDMTAVEEQDGFFIFRTPNFGAVDIGDNLYVRAIRMDGGLFTDHITVSEKSEDDGRQSIAVVGESEVSAEENFASRFPIITRNEIWNGGSHIPPKTVARARVVYMAHIGAAVHFGRAGSLLTTHGPLSEGWGSGHVTCVGNGPCYADEWEVGPHGSHHLRFYRGGTFSPGGGGSGRAFIRRGRR